MKKSILLLMMMLLAGASKSMDVSCEDAMKMHEESLRNLALFFKQDIEAHNKKIQKNESSGYIHQDKKTEKSKARL